ncbi:MAG: hypothetical protein FD177_193 [Desulfovibrionaceae bacterium]|nr:MAG: hypothetical protein FD177_193 [Desulfovibrionaceae bacterium]
MGFSFLPPLSLGEGLVPRTAGCCGEYEAQGREGRERVISSGLSFRRIRPLLGQYVRLILPRVTVQKWVRLIYYPRKLAFERKALIVMIMLPDAASRSSLCTADRHSAQKKGPVQLRTGPVGWYKVMSRCLVAVSLADTVELDGCSVCSVPGSIHCPVALVCSTLKGTVHLQNDPMASPPLR